MGVTANRPAIGGKGKKKFEFNYRPRTADEIKKRATQTGGGRDTFIDGNVKLFNAKSGDFKVRICPPTWDDAEHFGLEVWVHYGIGPDNAGYLCPQKMKGEACPLCEARMEAEKDGDVELVKALRPTKRVLIYLVDRAQEGDGPKAWASPWSNFDKEVCAQAFDADTGEVVPLDNPDEGYDVHFSVEGIGEKKQYVGVKIARKASPIADDDDAAMAWLQFITENPLPNVLIYHDYDHMKESYEGKSSKPAAGEEKPRATARPSAGKAKVTDAPAAAAKASGRPRIGGAAAKPKEEEPQLPTWEEVHEMDFDAVCELCEQQGADFGTTEFASVEEFQDWLCETLGITADAGGGEPEPEPAAATKGKGSSLKERLAALSKKK